jgi:uncharacterized protein DUF3467
MPDNANTPVKQLTQKEVQERTQSQDVELRYFNYARTAASFYDLKLFFGQGNVSPRGEQSFKEELCIALSPEFAKTFRDSLMQAIEIYEKTFGEIRPSPKVPAPEPKRKK